MKHKRSSYLRGNNGGKQKRNITQVINDHSKRFPGFIRKRVPNDADAIEQLTGWLLTVARNKITGKQRKNKPDRN